jgi:choline dehydrogenase-like flavoprotein
MSTIEPVEVCIIGGGVAGSMLAFELAGQGIEVRVLEAGPRHDLKKRHEYMRNNLHGINPWVSDNPERDRYTSKGTYRYPLNDKRVKGVGGSGLHWAGLAARLHESDFELHSRYGVGFDWPIRYHDLEAYYTRAEKLVGVSGPNHSRQTPWRSEPYPMPAFPVSYSDKILKVAFDKLGIALHQTAVARTSVGYEGRPPCLSFSMCDTCPILAKWTPDLLIAKAEKTGKVTVMPNTRVTRINSNKTGTTIESVTAESVINGARMATNYRANIFVLAAHTVESTRLLLLSKSDSHPKGLGNRNGYVGKNFMEHPYITIGAELNEKTYTERIGFETSYSLHFYELSRQSGANAFILIPENRAVISPWDIARKELQKQITWGDELKKQVADQFGYTAEISAMIEQLPYEENQISLDEAITDELGLPVPKIVYSFKREREQRTIEKAAAVIHQIFEALNARNIRPRVVGMPAHHLGTCRMGNDSRSSIVDPDLRVHGIDNIYIVGGSVFPSSGAVAPTLTIAALSLRLGDHLRARLKGTPLTH